MVFNLPTDPSTAENYNLWRKDAVIWQKLTCIPKAKQGLALQYACKSNNSIHEAILNIDAEEAEGDNGFNKVLKVLDSLHNYDEHTEEIKFYDRFQNLKREEGQAVIDTINQFDFLIMKLEKYDNKFNDITLAEKLIKAANLTPTQCEIIKASASKFDYISVKSVMKQTFANMTTVPTTCDNKSLGLISKNNSQETSVPSCSPENLRSGHQSYLQENPADSTLYRNDRIISNAQHRFNMNLRNQCTENYSPVYTRKRIIPNHCVVKENFMKTKIINDKYTCNNCDICLNVTGRPLSLKKMPTSMNFNDLVVVDIKSFNGILLLHILDVNTLYSVTSVLKSKDYSEVKYHILKYWNNIFGSPLKMVSTNRDLVKNELIVSILSSENTWCDDLCEDHNRDLSKRIEKILNQTICSLNIAVTWAVNAKNCTKRIHGYTSAQLIFGFNPLLPGVNGTKPPILSNNEYSAILDEHLELQKSARKLFVKSELSVLEKRKLNNSSDKSVLKYIQGDKVIFKEKYENIYQGAAVVICHDDNFVLVNHLNSYIVTHATHLELLENSEVQMAPQDPPHITKQEKCAVMFKSENQKVDTASPMIVNQPKYELSQKDEQSEKEISPLSVKGNQMDVLEEESKDFSQSFHLRMNQNNFEYTWLLTFLLFLILCFIISKMIFVFVSNRIQNINYLHPSDECYPYFNPNRRKFSKLRIKSRRNFKIFVKKSGSKIEFNENQEEISSIRKDKIQNVEVVRVIVFSKKREKVKFVELNLRKVNRRWSELIRAIKRK